MIRKLPLSAELLLCALLIAFGCVARALCYEHFPNFSAIAAIALFAGFAVRSGWLAALTPALILAFSNAWLGLSGYEHWGIMLSVYGCLMLPAMFGHGARRLLASQTKPSAAASAGLIASGVGSSLLFFVVTNFAHWALTTMYAKTFAGLAQCYVQALPFFKYTLAGDFLFALGLFGGYSLAWHFSSARETSAALAKVG